MYPLLPLALLLQIAPQVFAEDFNCKFSSGGKNYDLTPIGVNTVSREYFDTPSRFIEDLTFNLCDSLELNSGDSWDQCAEGTRACLIQKNRKGNEPDRIVRVVPLATASEMSAQISQLSGSQNGVNILMHGPLYPPDDERPDEAKLKQSFNISIICPSASSGETMAFKDYKNGQAHVEVVHRVACGDDSPPADNGGPPGGGSTPSGWRGVGYFSLVLFLAFGAYFALGAYYNYNKYGASGWDLVPHRDFWRDVPFLVRDVFNHLFSSIRPRGGSLSGRGGYVQV